jgi:hypothetical protein
LLEADVSIVVCNPLTADITTVISLTLLQNPKTILVLTCNPSSEVASVIKSKLQDACKPPRLGKKYHGPHIVFADPLRAIAANAILRADSRSPSAIQIYQTNFVASGVSEVTEQLRQRLSDPNKSLEGVRSQSSLAVVHSAIATMASWLRRAQDEVEEVFSDIRKIHDLTEEANAKVQAEVFSSPGQKTNIIAESFQISTKEVKKTLDRLTWWRLPLTVDDTCNLIESAVHRTFCLDLEKGVSLKVHTRSSLQVDTLVAHSSHRPSIRITVRPNEVHLYSTLKTLGYPISFCPPCQ